MENKKMKTKKTKKGGAKTVKRKKYIYNCFTLTEIMVAMAIVGILASVALVSIGAYRAKGQSEKVKASLDSVVTGMTSCWSFGGLAEGLNRPDLSCGAGLCSLGESYGKWPDISKIGDYSYDDQNAEFSAGHPCDTGKLPDHSPVAHACDSFFQNIIPPAKAAAAVDVFDTGGSVFTGSLGGLIACPAAFPLFCQNTWYFSASSVKDQKKICCNQKMKGCKVIDYSATCDNSVN